VRKRELQRGGGQRDLVAGANRLDPANLGQYLRRRIGIAVAGIAPVARIPDAKGALITKPCAVISG
jgi:hypothetical protein